MTLIWQFFLKYNTKSISQSFIKFKAFVSQWTAWSKKLTYEIEENISLQIILTWNLYLQHMKNTCISTIKRQHNFFSMAGNQKAHEKNSISSHQGNVNLTHNEILHTQMAVIKAELAKMQKSWHFHRLFVGRTLQLLWRTGTSSKGELTISGIPFLDNSLT